MITREFFLPVESVFEETVAQIDIPGVPFKRQDLTVDLVRSSS
jgi:hypothetical protein